MLVYIECLLPPVIKYMKMLNFIGRYESCLLMSFTETIKGEFPLYIFNHLKFITTTSVKNQCRTQNLRSPSNFSLKIFPNILFSSHPIKRESSILLFRRDSLLLGEFLSFLLLHNIFVIFYYAKPKNQL